MKRLLWLMIFALAVAGSVSAQDPTPTPTYRGTISPVDSLGQVQVSRTTTTGTLTLKVGSGGGVDILEVRVHLNAVGTTQTLTVSIENSTSSNHDVVLDSQAMASVTDYVWRPTPCAVLGRDDVLAVEWGNSGNKTVGASVFWRMR